MRLPPALLVAALASCGGSPSPAPAPVSGPKGPSQPAPASDPIADAYREAAARIIEAARAREPDAWRKLEELTVHIGPRLAGSEGLERAVAWSAKTMEAEGHESVRVDPVKVPHWVRGAESAKLIAPRTQPLSIIGLGGTVATPAGGLEAEIVVVSNADELAARAAEVKGKIVVYNAVMPAYDRDKGDGYDAVYPYRKSGADWAAAHGAAGVLVRSLTNNSLGTPHTGGLTYSGEVTKIPAAAISIEGAELLARLAKRGPVKIALTLSGEMRGEADSGNVIAELRGREKPDEIVLIGAHIDSWDVGQGAHDDGGGCVAVMEALTTLRLLGLRPRRTIRVVLFTNEENGLRGGIDYAKRHGAEPHVVAMESDGGVFAPRGWMIEVADEAARERSLAHARSIASLLGPVKATEVRAGFSGADLIPLLATGVPGVGHWVEGDRYFDVHHTIADTIDKVDPGELADNVAAIAVFAYVAADMEPRFGR